MGLWAKPAYCGSQKVLTQPTRWNGWLAVEELKLSSLKLSFHSPKTILFSVYISLLW